MQVAFRRLDGQDLRVTSDHQFNVGALIAACKEKAGNGINSVVCINVCREKEWIEDVSLNFKLLDEDKVVYTHMWLDGPFMDFLPKTEPL